MSTQDTAVPTPAAKKDELDKALEGTFPASDPVSVGSARKEREARIEREKTADSKIPKIDIDDAAMPAEKPM